MYFGIIELSWWGYFVLTLGLTHISIVGVTIYLHRHQAHRALDLSPLPSHFFRFWLWLWIPLPAGHPAVDRRFYG